MFDRGHPSGKTPALIMMERLGMRGSDIVVAFNENSDAGWSFGDGTARFLTGHLA